MKTVTRDMMEKQCEKLRNASIFLPVWITSAVVLIMIILSAASALELLWFHVIAAMLSAALAVSIPAVYGIAKRKTAPDDGYGKTLKNAMYDIQYDYISDNTVNKLFGRIGEAESFAEQTMVKLVLCDIYQMRGEYSQAIRMLDSVNKAELMKYPTVGLSYFNTVTDIYTVIGDPDSVLAAYADAEPFIDECAERNYPCCQTALAIIIRGERAKADKTGGSYQTALNLQLLKNDYSNRMNASSQQGTPLSIIIRGGVFYDTAELFFLNRDYRSAAQYMDMGGPMLTGSRAAVTRANNLSMRIREGLNFSGQ